MRGLPSQTPAHDPDCTKRPKAGDEDKLTMPHRRFADQKASSLPNPDDRPALNVVLSARRNDLPQIEKNMRSHWRLPLDVIADSISSPQRRTTVALSPCHVAKTSTAPKARQLTAMGYGGSYKHMWSFAQGITTECGSGGAHGKWKDSKPVPTPPTETHPAGTQAAV